MPKSNKVFVFDNNFRGSFKKFSSKGKKKLYLVRGDIRKKDLLKIVKKVDVIYHLAFINGTKYFYEKPKLVLDVGIQGTKNILEIASQCKLKHFIMLLHQKYIISQIKYPQMKKLNLWYQTHLILGSVMEVQN